MFSQGLQVSTHVFHGQSVSLWLRLRSTRIEKFNTDETWPTDGFCQLVMLSYPANDAGEGRHRVLVSGASSPNTLVTTGKKYLPWLISFNQCIHSKQQRPLLASPHRKAAVPYTLHCLKVNERLEGLT